jgi:hypothetical protein
MSRSSWIHPTGRDARNSGAFDWFSAAVVVGLLAMAVAAVHGIVWLAYRLRARHRMRRATKPPICKPPAFYRKLEALLARMHLRRGRGQTSRELAAAAAGRLSGRGHGSDVTEIPADIVNAYYRVRFGGAALDKSELVAIEQALVHLTPAASEKGS